MSYATPAGDASAVDWVPSDGGGNVWSVLDDNSDADYALTVLAQAKPLVETLDRTLSPGTRTVRKRLALSSGSALARAALLDGDDTELAVGNWQEINTTPATYSWVLTTAGDASRVRVEFQSGASALLLEDGSNLLMETGDRILLE